VSDFIGATPVLYRIGRYILGIMGWCSQFVSRLITSLALFLIPLILLSYYVYQEFFKSGAFEVGLPLMSFLSLIFVAIITTIFAFRLFITYFIDLLKTFKSDLTGEAGEFAKAAANFLANSIMMRIQRTLPWPLSTFD
jgi:hypothetical protein